ncbi:hypothetical protein HOK31_03280, partial [Candidatus Poribacteria bacterium]|nr:hypothetical protein [Candidatus Poribacteria bacterium]
ARVLRADPAKLEDVVGILTAHQWYVCHRLALHAARQNIGERLHPTVVRMLLNRDYLAGYTVEREYMELAEVAYPLLSGKQRDSWVALVARGPRRKGEGPWSDELRAQWTGQRMAPFADTLTSEQREAVRRWWPPHTEASVRAPRYQDEEKVWVGPTSPVAEAAMGEMSVPDVAAYLTDGFEPSGESMSPSREGVSRVLSADVESRPHEYAASVEQFTTTAMHPTYVRGLVYGWYSAAKNDTPIEWAPALDLCDWVVDQGQEPELAQDARDEDAGWQRTRRWMASLLQQAVHARAPVELHERVWALLLALAEDDDPPRAAEPRPFDQHSDPYTQAINATRPLAIEGCIFYALWIRRRTADTETTGAPGFDRLGLSHVGAFLTQAIDDPSVAVRAVYGRLFPFIAAELSESWADRNRDAIFPTQGGESDRHFDAAFGTYLHFSGPRVPMLERLQDEYAYALRRVCTVDKGDRDLDADEAPLPDDDPATRDDGGTGGTPASTAGAGYGNDLAEHLLLFNIWGALDRGDRHQLMDAYLARAPEDVRDHGLAYIGRLIRRDGGPDLPADVNRRLQALVQHELDRTLELGQEMSARSAPLIQWLTSGVFDAIWALKRLAKLLARYDAFGAPMVYSEQSGIVTFLGGAPEENLQHVGWCVLAYVEAKRDGYLQRDWEDTLTSLLRRMYASDSPAIRKRGEQAIHRLGELGQFGFGELLLRQPDASAE